MAGHTKTHYQDLALGLYFLTYVTLRPVAAFLAVCLPVSCTPIPKPKEQCFV